MGRRHQFSAAIDRFRGRWCDGSAARTRERWSTRVRVIESLGEWNLRPVLGTVRAPTLVVHSAADALPLWSSRAWVDAIPGARLLVLDGAGTSPGWSSAPGPLLAQAPS